jgi:hypothetical protein
VTKEIWTSAKVKALLQSYYGGGGKHAVLFEVRNATGFDASRSIDAVTMSLWPSLGLELCGMEIKISRSDWLRELKEPAKASTTFEYFDRWYLVAPRDVAKIDEIPGPWGWIAPEGDKLVTLKKAPLAAEPKPIDRKFLASILRCGAKNDDALIEAAIAKATNETSRRLQESHAQRVDEQVNRKLGEIQADANKYKNLRKELGENLVWMDDREIIAAVRIILNSGVAGTWNGIRAIQKRLTEAADKIGGALSDLHIPEAAE